MINKLSHLVYDGPSDKHGEWVRTTTKGGVQAAIVTVPLIPAYEEAFKSVKRGGRVVAVGLPSGKMSLSILDFVINGIELVASVVGTRHDMQEALQLAKLHKITCKVEKRKLEDINEIFDDMINYKISGRVVLDFSAK
jgi:propanol-preferring alcohol dehydrogenase